MPNIIDSIQVSGVTYNLNGGGSTYSAGTNIDITNDVISMTLPISAGTGYQSIMEGNARYASGIFSHAEGHLTTASGDSSHAEGYLTTANGNYSHAEGYRTTAINNSEHASGRYNVSSMDIGGGFIGSSGNTLFSVGNGNSNTIRHNAFEIRQNGDIYIADTNDASTSNYYEKPMIKLQDALASGGGSNVIEVTQAEYDALVSGGTVDPNALYVITDASSINLGDYYTAAETDLSFVAKMNNIVSAITFQNEISSSDSDITEFKLSGTSGMYVYFTYGWKNSQGDFSCCYNCSFYFGNNATINNGTVTYDSTNNVYTFKANDGYSYYNINNQSSGVIIYTETTLPSGQTAAFLNENYPTILVELGKKLNKSQAVGSATINVSGNQLMISLYDMNGNQMTSNYVQPIDAKTIISKDNRFKVAPVSASTTIESQMNINSGSCYQTFSFNGANGYADYYNNDGDWKIYINSAFTELNNYYIRVYWRNCPYKDYESYYYNGNFYIYYKYDSTLGKVVYSIANSSNYSDNYTSLSETIKSNYYLDIELTGTYIYFKHSETLDDYGYYRWLYYVRFNQCQNVGAGYNYVLIDKITTLSNEVEADVALQTVYSAYESGLTSGDVQTMIDESVSGKLDTTTFNAVMGSMENALYSKQDKLTAGSGITLNGSTISVSGMQPTLSAGTGINITDNVISVTGGGSGGGVIYTAGTNIDITNDVISMTVPISAGTGANSVKQGMGQANGIFSHAEGVDTQANGSFSHAEGAEAIANGDYSHAQGMNTVANNMGEFASGWFNVSNSASTDSGTTLFSVGNGTSTSDRKNAFEIRKNGDIYISSGGTAIKLQDNIGGGGDTSSFVTTGTSQNINGEKTFVGNKRIKFKQSSSSDKLGFTLYNQNGNELSYFEGDGNYAVLGTYWTSSTAQPYVGFSVQNNYNANSRGYYKFYTPRVTDVKTSFPNVSGNTAVTFYAPLGFKVDSSTIVKTDNTGVVDLSSYIGGGGGGGSVTVDTELSSTSTNPVQNKVIYQAIGDIAQLLSNI